MPKKRKIDAGDEIAFDIDEVSGGLSGEAFTAGPAIPETAETAEPAPAEDEMSPVFKLLARPTLPELKHETRARLMMQSPTRLYFYWSVGRRSFQALQRTVGSSVTDYNLVLRLINLVNDVEELHRIEVDGSWWFNAEPDTEYRAEIGFYSTSRPFVRILFSNSIATPRKGPSTQSASEAQWAVTTHDFAKLLDASGFEEDAFDVAREQMDSEIVSRFARHIGVEVSAIAVDPLQLKRGLALLASGSAIEDLKFDVGSDVYSVLSANLAKLTPDQIMSEIGGIDQPEYETLSAVGGSLVNIPRRRFRPLSSVDLG